MSPLTVVNTQEMFTTTPPPPIKDRQREREGEESPDPTGGPERAKERRGKFARLRCTPAAGKLLARALGALRGRHP
jgi:hypothetical protein